MLFVFNVTLLASGTPRVGDGAKPFGGGYVLSSNQNYHPLQSFNRVFGIQIRDFPQKGSENILNIVPLQTFASIIFPILGLFSHPFSHLSLRLQNFLTRTYASNQTDSLHKGEAEGAWKRVRNRYETRISQLVLFCNVIYEPSSKLFNYIVILLCGADTSLQIQNCKLFARLFDSANCNTPNAVICFLQQTDLSR